MTKYPVSLKKATGIFLLICITLPFWGSYGWLILSKQVIKKEIKQQILAGIDKDDLILLTFTKAETRELLRWEHEKEFEYLGHMYDVVETGEQNGRIAFWCYPDHQETSLNKRITTLVEKALGNHPQQKEHQKRFITFLQISYLSNPFNWQAVNPEGTSPVASTLQADCCSGFPDHPIPPPKQG